jgi:hypothetical protein
MTLPTTPGELFRHTDGGIYRFVTMARHTDNQAPLVVYDHVWPFDKGEPWARPAVEWTPARFTPIIEADLVEAMKQDRATAQADITTRKAARRAAEQAAKAARE